MPGFSSAIDGFRRRWHSLSLGSKFNLLFCLAGLAGLVLGALALDRAVSPAFDRLEREAAGRQVERARAVLTAAVKSAQDAASDYAVWDDSFDYVAKRDPGFEAETITPLAAVNSGVNVLGYVRFDGDPRTIVYSRLDSPAMDEPQQREVTQFATAPALRELMRNRASLAGFVTIGNRILAVAMGRVVKSDESGSPAGFVIMAKELDAAELSAALQAPVTVQRSAAARVLAQRGESQWSFAVPVPGLNGKSLGQLDFAMPRDIARQGRNTLRTALATAAAILLLALGAIYLAVRRLVVSRVRRIDDQVERVAGAGKLVAMDHDPSEDELGSLNHNFNRMISQLRDLQEQNEVQSFELGRSETSAGVLHNVRNSLNPVTVIVGQVLSERVEVNLDNVERALRELEGATADPGRRERLVAFLFAALGELERHDTSRREALITARAALSEALDILGSSNDVAEKDIPVEPVDLLDVVNRNAAVCRFAPWGEIEVDLPDRSATVLANRLLLSQVVGNLMTNAVEAIVASDHRPGRMRLALVGGTDAADGCVSLSLEDDGVGFDPAAATRLFERGESSKKGKSGGLGLHWCANTVRAMGGTLDLVSDGAGQGAKATLRLKAA